MATVTLTYSRKNKRQHSALHRQTPKFGTREPAGAASSRASNSSGGGESRLKRERKEVYRPGMVRSDDPRLSFAQPKGGCNAFGGAGETCISGVEENPPAAAATRAESAAPACLAPPSAPALVSSKQQQRAEALVGKRVSVYWNGDKVRASTEPCLHF